MKRQRAAYVDRLSGNMTPEEQIEFWRKRSEEFMREQDQIRAKERTGGHTSQTSRE